MPFYEYQCTDCGGRFVRQQRMSDPPATECPTCGRPVRKVMNAPGISVRSAGSDPAPACAPGGG